MKRINAVSVTSLGKVVTLMLAAILFSGMAFAGDSAFKAVDPGVRAGASPAVGGGMLPTSLAGLSATEQAFFASAMDRFQEVDSVSGTIEAGAGLGPRFNSRSCAACHAGPAVGGSSPAVNPQVTDATADGATNTVPSFITATGPVREVRFVNNPDGTPDGGVHDLFTITGRTDAVGCNISQPDFATQFANGNIIFRTPTPVFGLGLVENTADASLIAQHNFVVALGNSNGISGHFNRSGNDGTITRFGWKAQNKSLMIFAGEAYNVEQGVTNENFPNNRGEAGVEDPSSCLFNGNPEDSTNLTNTLNSGSDASDFSSDIVNFAAFMRLNAPAAQVNTTDPSVIHGERVFAGIGCNGCHARTQTTAQSTLTSRSSGTYVPRSDFAVHHMGTGLADNVGQGNAGADEFRTAPLWGAGQRRFFLHDGRTSDLRVAIDAHEGNGSEANAQIERFEMLSASDQQDVLNYLRSL